MRKVADLPDPIRSILCTLFETHDVSPSHVREDVRIRWERYNGELLATIEFDGFITLDDTEAGELLEEISAAKLAPVGEVRYAH